jgi:arylsulfatase A-like enzyme
VAMQLSGRNVVMVVLDSARADMFHPNAPNFRALAGEGMLFERAIAPAGWTLPSHASMFTGLRPTEHGIVALGLPGGSQENLRNSGRRARALAQQGDLLAPWLEERGVRTLSATSTPWLWPASGLSLGFQEKDFFYFLPAGPMKSGRTGALKRVRQVGEAVSGARRYARWIRDDADKGSKRVLDKIASFASRPGPFFAFTNLIETHQPHFPPRGYASGSALHRMRLAADVVLQPPLVRWLRIRAHNYGTHAMSSGLLERWREAYAAEIRYVDAWITDLVEALDSARVLDETVLIVTADHGESFGEGGFVGHGLSVSEAAGHVPLGIWGSDISPKRISDPVSLCSLASTVKALLVDGDVPGSLLQEESRGFAAIEVEHPHHVSRPPRGAKRVARGPGAAFYDGSLKLVEDPFGGRALYELSDPASGEARLLPDGQPTARQSEEAEAWRARISGAVPRDDRRAP